jgi:hypothetical protein
LDMSSRTVTTVAGHGSVAGLDVDGYGTLARFLDPYALAIDSTHTPSILYIADRGSGTIRGMNLDTYSVTVSAGIRTAAFPRDGRGSNARFYRPENLFFQNDARNVSSGNVTAGLYVADIASSGMSKAIRFVYRIGVGLERQAPAPNTTGLVLSPPIGAGGTYNPNVEVRSLHAPHNQRDNVGPYGVCRLGGFVYLSSTAHRIYRQSLITHILEHVAGSSSGMQDGPALTAKFYNPRSLVSHFSRPILYVADASNNRVRSLDMATQVVDTIAGFSSGHLDGYFLNANFQPVYGIFCAAALCEPTFPGDTHPDLYVATAYRIRLVTNTLHSRVVTTLAGNRTAHGI